MSASWVEAGTVTLEGEVESDFQRTAAEKVVQQLTGIKRVSNKLTIRSQAPPNDLKDKVKRALDRRADIDTTEIRVEAVEGDIIVSRVARSLLEMDEAVRVAKSAPGVLSVENNIIVCGT